MNIKHHFISSTILTLLLYPLIGFYSLWAFVGGYLIDFDHYLWSMYRNKSFSLIKAYKYHFGRHKQKNYEKDLLHVFHTWEFIVLMIVLSIISYTLKLEFFYYMFSITLLGMTLHLALDFGSLITMKHLDARAISLMGWIKRKR